MAQEYDISEFWAQYDERSVRVATPLIFGGDCSDTFLDQIDDLFDEQNPIQEIQIGPIVENIPIAAKRKQTLDDDERIIKKMYGVKEKHDSLMSEEDKLVKNRIEEIFAFMKKQNT